MLLAASANWIGLNMQKAALNYDDGSEPSTASGVLADAQQITALVEARGHRVLVSAAGGGVHLQQYDWRPGGLRHGPINAWRIDLQQSGNPRLERWMGDCVERQQRTTGLISISSAETEQRWEWDCAMQTTSLFIESSILTRLAIEVDRFECALHTPLATDDKIIKFAILALLEEYTRSKRIPQIILSTVGHYVATHLLLRYAKNGVSSTATSRMPEWQLRRALEYIEAHLGRDIGLDDLAAVAGMTPHYFCRAFRLSTGVPPYRYLLNRRIERAKELLRLTRQSVTEIALDVGFMSPAHFSSAFRSAAGSTPSAYRRAAGEGAAH